MNEATKRNLTLEEAIRNGLVHDFTLEHIEALEEEVEELTQSVEDLEDTMQKAQQQVSWARDLVREAGHILDELLYHDDWPADKYEPLKEALKKLADAENRLDD